MPDVYSLRESVSTEEPAVTLEAFTGQSNATAVRIEPSEDARELLPHLSQLALVEINFPVFGDGRGYSAARILREAGYTGELRACGDVLVDQIAYMARCGFDSFAPDQVMHPNLVEAALARFPAAYQVAADAGQKPIWALRHG